MFSKIAMNLEKEKYMITSTSNAQVKALSKLIKNARARRQQQVYIVEGIRMFRETPEERIEKIYASESFA